MKELQRTNWQLACLDGGEPTGHEEWQDVRVPVLVQNSPFGLPVSELYKGDRIGELDWMRRKHWAFQTAFTVPPIYVDEETVYVFSGIDYRYDIYRNGTKVLSREGMFSPVEIPVSSGDNTLTVIIHPFAENKNVREHLKARCLCGDGWDFAPKLQSAGFWDEAGLAVRKKLRVTCVNVKTTLGNDQRADAVVYAELSQPITQGTVTVELAGVRRSFPVAGTDRLALPVHVPSPKLWWPNGFGEANLVELKIWLGDTLAYTAMVGLRSLDRVACDGQGAEDYPLQLVVNNRKVFIKGVNWVPPDACPAEITTEGCRVSLRMMAGISCPNMR